MDGGYVKKRLTIHSGERELIRNVIHCCDEESRNKSLSLPLHKATLRAAKYCNVSEKTVKRIRNEAKKTPNQKLSTPGKTRKRPDYRNVSVDGFDRRVILDTMRDFYVNKKIVPSCKKLLPVLKEKINFQWSEVSLRRVLKDMGFKWRKCCSKRKILVERPDIVNWRYKYLRQIKQFRESGKKIFYLDETWVDSNITFQKCWQSPDIHGVLPDINSKNRLIIVDIGSEDGFLEGGRLVYRANTANGDYHGQMNSNNFEKWIRERVIPNLPVESVVVIDNAPYHGEQHDKVPTKSSTKKNMLEWLLRHGQHFEETSVRKATLYDAIQRLKPPSKVFKIDKLLEEFGHFVLRLPPYMCDLNAIEFVWANVKQHVRSKNTSGNMSLGALNELVLEALTSVSSTLWKKYTDHVKNIEKEYWEKDGITEDAIDEIIINLGEDSDDESSSSSLDEEESTHLEVTSGMEEDDVDLAQPLPENDN